MATATHAGGPVQARPLFGQLLRAGPARSGPIFDRLDAAGVERIVGLLSPDELALLAKLVLAPDRVARAATFETDTLVTLMRAASSNDAMRLYATLSPERSREVRRILCERMAAANDVPVKLAPTKERVGMVLRLRRLFRF